MAIYGNYKDKLFMKAWYVIYSKPRQERIASEQLNNQGYEVYLPYISTPKNIGGQASWSMVPMFPRYLFIRLCDESDNWNPVRSTVGVANIVNFSKMPAKISDSLVEEIRSYEKIRIEKSKKTQLFKKGDRVQILGGVAFDGFEADFLSYSSNDRVILLMKIVEKNIQIAIDKNNVEHSKSA